jgi:ABC-type bacteriocin/lantibiotic exporter with double-glycine peptidase domain
VTARRFFAPEVIQASAMDCGPASLKCLLEGYGTSISYGRLREACQTDVDGTSIDTLEEIAGQLGLDAEQVILPLDHLLLEESAAVPALVVLRMPGGATHFVVLWRTHGSVVQLMDPATGRRWTSAARFLDDCYILTTDVSAAVWREWAASPGAVAVMRRRLTDLGVAKPAADALLDRASADSGWRTLGGLDAAARMTASLVSAGGVRRGREAEDVLNRLFEGTLETAFEPNGLLPDEYWTVRPGPPTAEGHEQVKLTGAVLITARGTRPAHTAISPELTAALHEKPSRPGRELLKLLAADGALAPTALLLALLMASGGVLLEALLFRGFFDLGRELGLSGQRLGAIGLLIAFLALLLFLEFPLVTVALRMGRHLECRLRLAFLEKIPRLGDRYFQSRLKSDMTERSHSLYRIRRLPDLGSQLLRYVFELVLTAAGIAWLDPRSAPLAALSASVALLVPLAVQPWLNERDLRVRTHMGALGRYYLDALLGLRAIRCHGAERPIRLEHEALLVEWARAGFRLQRLAAGVEAIQLSFGFALSVWLLFDHLSRNREVGGMLLLVYWALNLPMLGQEIAQIAWQYPSLRNTTLRLLEPLGALEQDRAPAGVAGLLPVHEGGIAIQIEGVSVRAAGNTILEDVTVDIPSGAHVAIVGSSGAGKSSLVGLLLGWHRAATGRILVDGRPLEAVGVEALRREIAWVDPAVHLWNRPFIDNLCYGSPDAVRQNVGAAIEMADLVRVLQKMPAGLQTPLGESGSMVSGGEGQRVRLGRALLRPGVRLAILDEPFRGLEREQRRELLGRARRLWSDATLLCITHDIGETRAFERVLVIEQGRIVEDGSPVELAHRPDSRYRELLDAEESVLKGLWEEISGAADDAPRIGFWRLLRLVDGELVEPGRKAS